MSEERSTFYTSPNGGTHSATLAPVVSHREMSAAKVSASPAATVRVSARSGSVRISVSFDPAVEQKRAKNLRLNGVMPQRTTTGS